nr:MAG TPA: hypothetical protein [Bacteriophage sp.]
MELVYLSSTFLLNLANHNRKSYLHYLAILLHS